jgi:hypothetical protein
MLDWSNERFIKLYTRDTADWMTLSFDAQALFMMILRKVDRAGRLELGRHGIKAVAVAIGHGSLWSRLEPALQELLADGCLQITSDHKTLLVRNFVEAQEARKSNAQRQRDFKEDKRAKATPPPDSDDGNAALPDANETLANDNETSPKGNEEKHAVTRGNSSEQNRLEQNRNTFAPNDAKASPGAEATRPPQEPDPDPRSANRPDEPPPAQGTLAFRVFEVLRKDPQWKAIVPRPSELAQRIADPDAYPAIDVLGEVKKASAWLAANPKNRKKNGARFLLGWLGRGQERAPRVSDQPTLFQREPDDDPRLAPPKISRPKGKTIAQMTPEEREEALREANAIRARSREAALGAK